MSLLIAVITCHRYRERINVIRQTWGANCSGVALKFFLGEGGESQHDDEVILDVPDDYNHLPLKVKAAFGWGLSHGFERIFKTDDDVLVIPERLLTKMVLHDYVGRVRPASQENDAPRIYGLSERAFCSGFGYWLSSVAARVIHQEPWNGDWAEDRFVGNTLVRYGIMPVNDPRILLWPPIWGHFCTFPNPHCPRCAMEYAEASVICPYAKPEAVAPLHKWYTERRFIPTCLG